MPSCWCCVQKKEFCLEKINRKVKKFILDCFNGRYIKGILRRIYNALLAYPRYRISKTTKVVKNKLLFITTRGSFNCNPRAIVEEILRQGLEWDLVWVIRREDLQHIEDYPKALKLVTRGSREFYRELSASKILVDNSINLSFLNTPKKSEQILFETWHGSLGLKRFDTNNNKRWIRKAVSAGNRTDYCISNSEFETALFKNTFWKNAEILEYGHARNDVLLSDDSESKRRFVSMLRKSLGVPLESKIALYAPTFRDSGTTKVYNLDFFMLRESLEKRFGGNWIILKRLHFESRALQDTDDNLYSHFVVDVTAYRDIQDLLLLADVGITDYSSWICDFVLTKRPGFLFALDLDDYYTERGFLYPLSDTPFQIARNNGELMDNILNFDNATYQKKCENFIKDKGCIDDGHAAERIVEKFKTIIWEE